MDGKFFVFGKYGVPGSNPIAINYMKNKHRPLLARSKISNQCKLYKWKHTGDVACARAGMASKELQMQLRHASLDQVNIYLASMLGNESVFVKNNYPTL